MCIHCCRLRRTPCPPIPYSCPDCPVRTLSSICSASRRSSSGESASPMSKSLDSCDTLPARWLEVNRRVIYALAKKLDRSPEAAHYAVLLLLYANYGKVMMIARKRRSFRVPRSDFLEQDLFATGGSLFNDAGFLTDPMAPETLGKLLRMMQDYIFRLRQLNKRFNWYANGEHREEILCLLGEQDELLRMLRTLFGDSDAVPIPQLLRALNDLDFNYLFGKSTPVKSPWPVKSISKLYSEVVDPYKSKKCSPDDSRDSLQQIKEVTMQTVISPKIPPKEPKPHHKGKNPHPKRHVARSGKHRIRRHREESNERLISEVSLASLQPRDYRPVEMPRLVYEPFDSRKSSTWRTRYADIDRVLPDGRIAKRRVQHYIDTDKKRELGLLEKKSSENSEKDYLDMFGTDLRRRSTRKSLIRDKRKSFAGRKSING